MSLKNLLILWFLSLTIIACGYSFYKRPAYFKSDWKTIYIPPWKNFTSETILGNLLAHELRYKLSEGGFLIPVYDKSRADLILEGEVVRVYLAPVSYETFLKTKERRINFVGRYKLIDAKEGKVIFEKSISRYEIYRVPIKEVSIIDPGRIEALKLLSKDLAELILQDIMFYKTEF